MNELVLLEDLGNIYLKETSKKKERYGLYKCFCGNEFKTRVHYVRNGTTRSCGCYKKKVAKESNTTHGLKYHRLYSIWKGMLHRCNNSKNPRFKHYGERGIIVCKEWHDIKNFIDDMYPTFKEGLTLDRINVNGNYEPSNCRWTTVAIQNRNTQRLCKTNTSGYRGVCAIRGTIRYESYLSLNYKKIHIGKFDTALKAAKAYDKYIIDNNLEHTTNGLYTKA